MPRSPFRLALAVLAIVFSACGDASEPQGLEGTYSLHSVNSRRPPVAVWGSWAVGEVQVLDADVRLRAGGAASVELTLRNVGADSVAGPERRVTYEGRFERQGDALRFGPLTSADQGGVASASGVVISPREIAVTLYVPGPAYMGFHEYRIAMIARR
jgi:hypothetical protein